MRPQVIRFRQKIISEKCSIYLFLFFEGGGGITKEHILCQLFKFFITDLQNTGNFLYLYQNVIFEGQGSFTSENVIDTNIFMKETNVLL